VSDASLVEIMDALAGSVETFLGSAVPGIQVEGRLVFNPTPPCIDVYPADPFQEQAAFGITSREALFTVRARVTTADHEAGQELLLDFMDPRGSASLVAAIASDPTLAGTVDDLTVEGPSGFIVYQDASGANAGGLLGAEWRTRVILG
jgi:hypothetical protein